MRKSIHSPEYSRFLDLLKEARGKAGMTQTELADRLGMTQSDISKCERGERRLDVVELWRWCKALGTPFQAFARLLDRDLSGSRRS